MASIPAFLARSAPSPNFFTKSYTSSVRNALGNSFILGHAMLEAATGCASLKMVRVCRPGCCNCTQILQSSACTASAKRLNPSICSSFHKPGVVNAVFPSGVTAVTSTVNKANPPLAFSL